MKDFFKEQFNLDLDTLLAIVIKYGTKLILAGIVLWIGLKIVKRVHQTIEILFEKANVSPNLRPFLLNIIDVTLKTIVIFIALNILGANLSGLMALIAAVGFAIGMALQGSLGNFASGILILTLKPYKVGDWIQVDEKFGRVEEIKIFNTKVITPGKKVLIFPNSKITDDVVTNYSEKGIIRLEIDVHVPYETEWKKIKEILKEAIYKVPGVLENPPVEIGIADFDSHSLLVMVRPYVKPDDYWEVTFQAHATIKEALHKHHIAVPYSEGIEYGKFGQ
jgi:small conductance mechanosensitive channel